METANLILGIVGALGVVFTLAASVRRLPTHWRRWRRPPHPFAIEPEDRVSRSTRAFREGHLVRGFFWFTFFDDQRLVVVFNWIVGLVFTFMVVWSVAHAALGG